jgi:hypothetical protein
MCQPRHWDPSTPMRMGQECAALQHAWRVLLVVVAVAAGGTCAGVAQTSGAPPAGYPANLRWALVPKWISWSNDKATISWPPNDGCAATPVKETLDPGRLLDRFGSEGGTFFSPKGESFAFRAVPYVCQQMDYRIYRVVKPIPVKTCKAAPWFGEPGGAEQDQTAEPAYKLVAEGAIVMVSYEPGGGSDPYPQCGRP